MLERDFKLEEHWGSRDLVLKVGSLKARSGLVYSGRTQETLRRVKPLFILLCGPRRPYQLCILFKNGHQGEITALESIFLL
ncbi:hypothetical protein H70357_01105 [Paenibacillus sp. FSL H7-0357]|nr:hypothetical protein H70357_01105 [Paenibacillus sp. FSL H7-0357]